MVDRLAPCYYVITSKTSTEAVKSSHYHGSHKEWKAWKMKTVMEQEKLSKIHGVFFFISHGILATLPPTPNFDKFMYLLPTFRNQMSSAFSDYLSKMLQMQILSREMVMEKTRNGYGKVMGENCNVRTLIVSCDLRPL